MRKDYKLERRKYVIGGIVLVIACIYVVRLFSLQVLNDDYKQHADGNAFLKKTQYPSRGLIYDRNGKLLVFNQPAYDVMMIVREVRPFDTLDFCRTVGITKEQFDKRMADMKNRRLNPGYSSYTPQTFMTQLSAQDYGRLQEKLYRFPGFFIQNRMLREYAYPVAANVLGNIREVSPGDIEKDSYYTRGDYTGDLGIERSYENILRGEKGVEILLRDAHGRVKGRYEDGRYDVAPVSGKNLNLSLDIELQAYGEKLMQNKIGAIVAIEPSTGEILAMVSSPTYDPSMLVGRERGRNYLKLNRDRYKPLFDRALMAAYPPGSTFKILTTLEYIQEHADYENYSYTCTGSYTVGNHTIHCYGNKSHGTQNLRQAFANSCNAFYASLGMELDIDQFRQLCNKMLFNTSLPTDLQASKSSFVLDKSDGSSAIMATSIGQGQTLVTPFHMALLVSAINNDGVLMKPYVLDRVESSDGTLVEQYEPEEYGTLMTTDEAAILKDYMNYVVETGTGKKLSGQSYEAAGKTGSAEYSTGADSSHSWFVGYAHRDDKSDIAIAVIVEKAGVGSEYAVPIAKEVFDAYYNE